MALTQTQVSQLYVAIFNRASEGNGNEYWQAKSDMAVVATAMLATDDAKNYFGDSLDSDQAFVEHIYLNTLNKTIEDDAEGIAYWVGKLEGPGGATRGEVVAGLVESIESYGPDGANYDPTDVATVAAYNQFTNRVEVSNYMATEVEKPPVNYAQSTAFDEDLVVTDDPATVTSAKAAVDVLAEAEDVDPPVEGDTILLTEDTDRLDGTADNDFFDAPITQNPWAGGVSNSLSTADRLDGKAGTDTLHAQLVPEFFGVTGDNQLDVQPRIKSIEDIKFEAMDIGLNRDPIDPRGVEIVVDAKNISDVVKIGSFFSDGDLSIENLTTLTSAGVARNTDAITITMDHTDNFNTDGDASDLHVYFDEDYLLADQSVQSQAIYYLLDQDADLNDTDVDGDGVVDLLARINTNGLIFTVDGGAEQVIAFDPALLTNFSIRQHADFVDALQDALAALIAAGTVPADTTLKVDTTMTRTTFLDDGSVSSPIPAIVLESKSTTGLQSVGFAWVQDLSGEFNVYGRLADEEGTEDNPVAINVELDKVGRDNDGGDLIVGGKHDEGIPDFYVSVLGADDKPSSLGTITTNTNDLENVFISTHSDFLNGATFASLEVRNGFVRQTSVDLVDADEFLGDLILGSTTAVNDLIVLEARGGGDVTFVGDVDASGNAYIYTTGSGDDTFVIDLDGDAVDTIGESFSITTESGDDEVFIDATDLIGGALDVQLGVSQRTMATLDNLNISTSAGDDYVELSNNFNFDIHAGSESDFVYIDSEGSDAAVGTWFVGATTGPQPFVDRVLYQAKLTVTFAGFESTVAVDTDSAGNFVADQLTINAAIMAAIEANPELNRLLEVTLGTGDQFLTITSTVDGANELDIDLYQPELVVAGNAIVAGQVNLAAADVTSLLTGIIATDATQDSLTNPLAYVNTIDGSLTNTGAVGTAGLWNGEPVNLANSFMDDAASGANATGAANINFSTINMGTGANDLVALDSNVLSANILDIDAVFGKVSVVNFFDEAAQNTVGNHALDYTTFLNNQTDATVNSPANNLSAVPIAVTLDTTLDPAVAASIAANEVKMIRLDETATETFEGLTAAKLVQALNGDGTATDNYGNINNAIDAVASTATLVGNVQNHIFMVENDNNLGEYKVFHLTSTIDATTNTTDGDFDTASAVELGILDFGDSINFRLVGDATWAADLAAWQAIADGATPVVPNTAPVAVDDADAFTVAQGESVVISVADLLANDSDADADALTITAVADVATDDGTVVLAADGLTITFTAAAAFEGAASFEYTLFDGTATDTAAVTGAVTVAGAATTVAIAYGEEGVVAATAATEIFDFDAVTALADAGALVTQASITGFDTALDSLLLDIVTAAGATTLDQLAGVDGITVQADPFAGNLLVNFGSDANGGEPVTLTLVGVTDATLIDVVAV